VAPFRAGTHHPARLALAAAVLGALYALGASLPFWFLSSPEAGAAFFPPAGLTLAALLLSPRRTWPLWLAVVAVAEFSVDLGHGQTVAMALGFAAANVVEPLVGALACRRMRRSVKGSARATLITFLLCGVTLAPLVGGAIGATVARLAAPDGAGLGWLEVAGRWALGDAIGVLVVASVLLAWLRRWPNDMALSWWETMAMSVLATAVTLLPALVWHHPLIFAVLPVLMVAALRGGLRSVTVVGFCVAFAANWAAVTGRANQLVAGVEVGDQLVQVQFFLAVTLVAALALAAEVSDGRRIGNRLTRSERSRGLAELAALSAADAERQRIAQEIHDIVGHALNVVLLQAGAARRSMGRNAAQARTLLESIETVARDAFGDLDAAIGLADRPADLTSQRGLDSLPELVATLRRAGVAVELDLRGARPTVSTLVDWSAYRIIQESLTNVLKHAPQASARVCVAFEPDRLRLSIVDDGGVPAPPDGGGRGLIGLRERTTVLGGRLEYGPQAEGGFAVVASLPLQGPRG
jgi:signal transduction histidine kinase